MIKVVFFGNSEGVFSNRHFAALRETPCAIVGVVDTPPARRTSTNTRTHPDAPSFIDVARATGIPVFEPASPHQPEFVQTLAELQADLFVAIGYTNILRPHILTIPLILPVNFHPSLLPAYRGKHPLFWALRQGERWVVLTAHVIDAGIDTGDILYQVRVRTRQRDSVSSLYDRVIARGVTLIPRLIADAENGSLRPKPQAETGASYFSAITPDDFQLDWRRPAAEICRWINASPGQCFCESSGHRLYFSDAEARPAAPAPPGVLVARGRRTMTVAASDGAVRLQRVHGAVRLQRVRCEGQAPLRAADWLWAADWLRAHGLRPGDSLDANVS